MIPVVFTLEPPINGGSRMSRGDLVGGFRLELKNGGSRMSGGDPKYFPESLGIELWFPHERG